MIAPSPYFRLTDSQHKFLLQQGQLLYEKIEKRRSRLDVPSNLLTFVQNDVPVLTPVQKKMHQMEQEIEELRALAASNLKSTTHNSKQHLRSLDKEGALNQENEILREENLRLTQENARISKRSQEIEAKNIHLERKLRLFRIELQRKDEGMLHHKYI